MIKYDKILEIATRNYLGNCVYSNNIVGELEEFFERSGYTHSSVELIRHRKSLLPWKKGYVYIAVVVVRESVFRFELDEDYSK